MKRSDSYLSKREQQIMEIAYERGQITTADAMELLPGSPANSTVRTLLKILEEKGHLRHKEAGGKYVFTPVKPRKTAARAALDGVIQTFYRGSVGEVFVALLTESGSQLSPEEVERLEELIQQAKEDGR